MEQGQNEEAPTTLPSLGDKGKNHLLLAGKESHPLNMVCHLAAAKTAIHIQLAFSNIY